MKQHAIFSSVLLAFAFSTAAAASEISYIPSLPAPAMPVVPMLPRLPSRIDRIIPGQLPTRSLPGVPTIVPSLRLPAVSLPGPAAPRGISLPGPIADKRPVRLPGAVVATGKLMAASKTRHGAAEGLNSLFDGAENLKRSPVIEDDVEEISPVKGDSSHLTLPESDLEREIGLR